jgi:predicted secreted Zn-dependent protease
MESPMSWRTASRVSGEMVEEPLVAEDWASTKAGVKKRSVTHRESFKDMSEIIAHSTTENHAPNTYEAPFFIRVEWNAAIPN